MIQFTCFLLSANFDWRAVIFVLELTELAVDDAARFLFAGRLYTIRTSLGICVS